LEDVLEDAELVNHDLTNPVTERLPPRAYDFVYHLAAVVGVRRVEQSPDRTLATNVLAARNILEFCRRHPPRVFFLSSTSEIGDGAVAAGLATVPAGEDAPFCLLTPSSPRASYALSKIVSESLATHVCRPLGSRVRVARYHNVYGPRMGNDHVIPQLIERVMARCDPFPIYGTHQTRAFCHVDDAVEATLRLTALTHPDPLTVNVGNDAEEMAIIDVARRLFELAQFDPAVLPEPPPLGSPDRRRPDLSRLRSLTSFEPRIDFATGLRETFEWYASTTSRL
jgi:UDP-glucose 4-epimerase/UDP-glucuronate decarboxylase